MWVILCIYKDCYRCSIKFNVFRLGFQKDQLMAAKCINSLEWNVNKSKWSDLWNVWRVERKTALENCLPHLFQKWSLFLFLSVIFAQGIVAWIRQIYIFSYRFLCSKLVFCFQSTRLSHTMCVPKDSQLNALKYTYPKIARGGGCNYTQDQISYGPHPLS